MADVTTYKRSIMSYCTGNGVVVQVGDVRTATDAVVTANSQWWIALTDSEMSDGKHGSYTR